MIKLIEFRYESLVSYHVIAYFIKNFGYIVHYLSNFAVIRYILLIVHIIIAEKC